MKRQIEDMYEQSGNTKVTIVVQSMGAPTTLYFLDPNNGIVTQDWKNMYLHAFVSLSGAWAGSPLALKEQVSGGILRHIVGRLINDSAIARRLQSVYWLLPNPAVFNDTTVIIRTPDHTYTSSNYSQLFTNLGFKQGYTMYQGVENINKGFPDPGMPTYCCWGVGFKTNLTYTYREDFPKGAENDPEVTAHTDGDGVVNAMASEVCLQWNGTRECYQTFPNVSHNDMAKNTNVIEAVAKVVTNLGNKSDPKPSDKIMGSILNSMTSRNLRAYANIHQMIGKKLKMVRINNYYYGHR